MKKMLLISFYLILVHFFQTYSQGISVKGKVTDDKGSPLPGVSVVEKNTTRGTTTSTDGTFTLSSKPGTRLVASAVGYEANEVIARSDLNIKMTSATSTLTDVVVTGVGVGTSKKRVPIDVASVSSRDFAKSATTSIEQALTGQIAGAQIQQTSGQAGAPFNIVLRGVNSLGSSNPLILVDGVEVRDLTSLDPSNVERVEVVKGAAGGTLYGAQGANGVIQIFTKKGALNSKLAINVSSKVSIDNVLVGKDILAKNHHYVTDASGNILDASGNIISQSPIGVWSDPAVPDPSANPDLTNDRPYNIPTYDHLKQAFRTALTFTNSVSLNGGGPSTDYAFTASRLDQQDVFSNKFTRNNFSLNLGFQPFKGFTVRTISQAIVGTSDLLNGNRFNVLNAYPWIDFEWKDSTGHRPKKTSNASNSLNSLSEQEWHQTRNNTLQIVQNFNVNYKFPRFVELDYKYGINYSTTDAFDYYLNQSASLQPNATWGADPAGSITNTYSRNTFKNSLTTVYLKTDFIKDFNSKIPLRTVTQFSYDWRSENYRSYFSNGTQLPVYPPVNINLAAVKNTGDNYWAFTTFGVLINQTIEFGNIAGISAGFRSDYSSEFGAGSKPFTFPRGTIFFRPSELMRSHAVINDWKVRAAYGEAGIQPGRYQRQVTLNVATLGNGVAISLPTTASNPNLLVQRSKELEVGTDISINLLKGGDWLHKINFTGTYWKRNSDDVIQQADVAPSSGFNNRVDNLTSISSRGFDLSLDATMYSTPAVTWNMGVRWGVAKSKVDKISNGLDVIQGQFALKQGQEVGIFYGQTVLNSLDQLKPDGTRYILEVDKGKYTVANGQVVNISTNSVVLSGANDLAVIGKAYPNFTSSLINTFNFFKSLTISFQFDWVHGNNIYNLTRQWMYSPAGGSGGVGGIPKDFDIPVTINGKTGAFVNYYQSLYNLVRSTSWFVEDGSFVRLRDLSITYDLQKIVRANWVKRLSVTASGRNLLTFTKYSGLDPENTTSVDAQGNAITGTGASRGVDYFGIPNLRSYQLGVNIGF
jgi:TonB-linked SusC/RagA family outer membrane protein